MADTMADRLFEAVRAVLNDTRARDDSPAMRELDRAWHAEDDRRAMGELTDYQRGWVDGFSAPVNVEARAAAPALDVDRLAREVPDIEPTEDEVREYRLDAIDSENRRLNYAEWVAHRRALGS